MTFIQLLSSKFMDGEAIFSHLKQYFLIFSLKDIKRGLPPKSNIRTAIFSQHVPRSEHGGATSILPGQPAPRTQVLGVATHVQEFTCISGRHSDFK